MLEDENAASQAELPDDTTARSGTPMGPARWRGQLGSTFLDAVRADFAAHGVGVIARIRAEKPETYLKLVASLLPKDLNAAAGGMDELSDDQLIERIRTLDSAIRPLLNVGKTRARRSRRPARDGSPCLERKP
ncbi:hypothetical protein AU381_16660 [Sinorhizobium glycinis]|uniref:Uncharacterized protein n=1 Tax=Sinorhizobium glycinis TaxID=1472378 RepID=A0A178XKP9_9HYPH|nr:hypothetical protein [Sinorhizobium glycinis]OAP35817.1 hypothetical protein AU381_16660 [Sinorhizobium glycinis]